MKQFPFSATIPVALSMTFFLFSCNSGGDKKTTEATADTTAAKVTEPAPPAPPAKPGNVLVILHKVANFAKWKPGYESHDSIRQSYGLTNYVLGRGVDDSNMVYVVLKMADENKAKELTSSQGMKDRMKKDGVTGTPSFEYIETVMTDTSTMQQPTRVRITHKVKDWDAWKKEFDSHKQARTDAGLIDRSVGHSADDNHMVSVVLVVTDMAKAKAFMASKDLKDKMEKSGVVGPPTIFWYNIVQKY